MLPRWKTLSTLPWCRNFFTLPQRRNYYGAQYPTMDQYSHPCFRGIRPLSTLPRCKNFSTHLRRRNYYGARYPTTDQHSRPCIYGTGPFLHFHDLGTSNFLFQESLWFFIPNNRSAQSSMHPRYRTLFTIPPLHWFKVLIKGNVLPRCGRKRTLK